MSALAANPADERRSVPTEQLFGHWDKIHDILRSIFPTKTAENLAAITNTSVRGWEYSLSQRRKISLESFLALLDTRHGPEILNAALEHSKQPWVRDFRRMWQLAELKDQQRKLQKRIDALGDPS